jgi:hypothetical protein
MTNHGLRADKQIAAIKSLRDLSERLTYQQMRERLYQQDTTAIDNRLARVQRELALLKAQTQQPKEVRFS